MCVFCPFKKCGVHSPCPHRLQTDSLLWEVKVSGCIGCGKPSRTCACYLCHYSTVAREFIKDLILIRHTAYRLQCKSCSSSLLIWIVADWAWGIEFESRSEEEIPNMARKSRNWLGCWFRNWLYKVSVHRYNVLWCFYSRPNLTHVCSVVRFGCGSVLLLMGGWNLCVWTALICNL